MNASKLPWIVGLIILASCPMSAHGQDYTYREGIYGGSGYGRFYEDEGSLGSGITYRAGAEWRPLLRGSFEAELFGIRFHRGDNFHVEGNTQFVLANATWYFRQSRIQPYVKGGLGAYRTRYSFSWPGIPINQISKNGTAVDFGAGVRFFVDRHWSVNPDLRVIGGVGYYSLFSYFSMSAAYHW
jgi:opacity protein-like surface antigen